MLFIQCHFLYLDAVLAVPPLGMQAERTKKNYKAKELQFKKKTNSGQCKCPLFII